MSRSDAIEMVREELDALQNALAQLQDLAAFAGEPDTQAQAHDLACRISCAVIESRKKFTINK